MKKNRGKKLLKNTFILSLGTFFPKFLTIIMLPLLTACLTKAQYGTYDLITTLVSLLLPAVTLQIQSAAFRFLIDSRRDEVKKQTIVTNIVVFTLLVSLIPLIILYFILYKINFFLRILIIIYFYLDILLITIRQVARGIGDNMGFAINSIIYSFLLLIFTFVFLRVCKMSLNGVILSLILASFISLILLLHRIKVGSLIKIKCLSLKVIKRCLNYSWPMVPNNLSNWVLSLSDRVVITSCIGIEANAIYAIANKFPNLLKIFQSTFTNAWQENASLCVDDNDSLEYYSNMFDIYFCILVGFICCLLSLTPILFKLLIKGDYSSAYFQMPILYLGMFFSSIASFIGGIYIAHMNTKSVGITTLVAAGINLVIDLAFVKKIGIYAGSISTLISYFVLAVYRMKNVKSIQPIRYDIKKIFFSILLLFMLSIMSYKNTIFLNCLIVIITIMVNLILNSKIIKMGLNMVKEGLNVKKTNKKSNS